MKRKILKYSSVFSLWFAGFVLVAHLLLPHDHHIADTFSNQDENCPVSNDKSHHHSGFPVHCHAFNDIVSEKLKTFQISQNIQLNPVTFSILTDISDFKIQSSNFSLIDFSKPIFDPFALDLSLLRAPPVFA